MALWNALEHMTAGERTGIKKIVNEWEQPRCPSCNEPMELSMDYGIIKPDFYSACYLCNKCRIWHTENVHSKGAYIAATNAYKQATLGRTAVACG